MNLEVDPVKGRALRWLPSPNCIRRFQATGSFVVFVIQMFSHQTSFVRYPLIASV